MTIGQIIKEKRSEKGLTQKALAESLNVSYQAVSRWENDEVEPSIGTLKSLAKIFECSLDELMGMEADTPEAKEEVKEEPVPQTVVVQQEPVLGVCESCKKVIHDSADYQIWEWSERHGRHTEHKKMIVCADCKAKKEAEVRRQKEAKERARRHEIDVRRVHSFIWPTILAVVLIAISITRFVAGDTNLGLGLLIGGILGYFFLADFILFNNVVPEVWVGIASKTVHLPGVIFSADLDGVIFLVAMKIFLMILGFLAGIALIVLATGIAGIISPFVYPVALSRSLRYTDDN